MELQYEILRNFFGVGAPNWPVIQRKPPSRFATKHRRDELLVLRALGVIGPPFKITQEMRDRYWEQMDIGQGANEDAGGFFWRCWSAMLGYEFEPPFTYQDAVEDILKGGTQGEG